MAITYPLAPPAFLPTRSVKIGRLGATAMAQSPFTLQQQVQEWPGELWTLQVGLAPIIDRAKAEAILAWLLALRGRTGTFPFGDPNGNTPGGSASRIGINIATFSEQFDNAIWLKVAAGTGSAAVVTANFAAGPDGSVTAERVQLALNGGTTSADLSALRQAYTAANGLSYVISGWIKTQDGSTKQVMMRGAVTQAPTPFTITGSWQRFTSAPFTGTGAAANADIVALKGVPVCSDSADLLVWGAQLEQNSVSTPYLATLGLIPPVPLVNGGGQSGKSLVTDGWPPNTVGILLAGDYIQVGSAETTRLYKVLTNVTTDNSGNATLDVFPRLRESPADNAVITYLNCKGTFRLVDNKFSWDLDQALTYGIDFNAIEAI